jgi:transcriptional regulator with XRE-family HTH domain
MTLIVLEDAIKKIHKNVAQRDFSQIIRDCRVALGLKQYRAAEFAGIAETRLKNLETGYFRTMPASCEIHAFARLYDLNPNILEQKAKEHCIERTKNLKSRAAFNPANAQV